MPRNGRPVLTVIFGAGASFDSSLVWPASASNPPPAQRPPLTKDLFQPAEEIQKNLLERWPEIHAIASDVYSRLMKGEDFESALEVFVELGQQGRQQSHVLPALMALRLYLRDLIATVTDAWYRATGGLSPYASLLVHLIRWVGGRQGILNLVTFNYDTLLERALTSALGRPTGFRHINDYVWGVRDEWIRVFKVHGSVDWVQETPAEWTAETSQRFAKHMEVPPVLRDMRDNALIQLAQGSALPGGRGVYHRSQSEAQAEVLYAPALAIPARRKVGYSIPQAQVVGLRNEIVGTDRLLIVGWAGNDQHLLDDLRREFSSRPEQTPPKIGVVDWQGAAGDIAKKIADLYAVDAGDAAAVRAWDEGFATFVRAKGMEEWLTWAELRVAIR